MLTSKQLITHAIELRTQTTGSETSFFDKEDIVRIILSFISQSFAASYSTG